MIRLFSAEIFNDLCDWMGCMGFSRCVLQGWFMSLNGKAAVIVLPSGGWSVPVPVLYSGALALRLGHHHPLRYYEGRRLVPSEGIWCSYFLPSVASLNRSKLPLCRLYNRIGHKLHDKEVYSNNIMDRIKDITRYYTRLPLKALSLNFVSFQLASRLKDILAAFAHPKIFKHTAQIFHLSPDGLVLVLLTQNLSRFKINYPNALSTWWNYDVMSTYVAVHYTVGVDGS